MVWCNEKRFGLLARLSCFFFVLFQRVVFFFLQTISSLVFLHQRLFCKSRRGYLPCWRSRVVGCTGWPISRQKGLGEDMSESVWQGVATAVLSKHSAARPFLVLEIKSFNGRFFQSRTFFFFGLSKSFSQSSSRVV
jgi:hypothetical protein